MTMKSPPRALNLKRVYDHPAHLLRRANQIFLSVFEAEMGETGLSPNSLIILAVLHEHPGVDLATLSYAAAIDKSSCGRTVAAMEKSKLLKVAKNSADGRQKSVFLTAAGRDLYLSCEDAVQRIEDLFFSGFDEDERGLFMETLRKFVTRNNDISRAPFREIVDS